MRYLHKSWSDQKPFQYRIRWYDSHLEENSDRAFSGIRLQLETPEGKWNLYPKERDEASLVWADFKANYKLFTHNSNSSKEGKQ